MKIKEAPERVQTTEELLQGMHIENLRAVYNGIMKNAETLKNHLGLVHAELSKRYAESMKLSLLAEKKEYGVRTENFNGVKVKMEIKKDVKWDNDMLGKIVKASPALEGTIIQAKYNVTETAYKIIPDAVLKAKLDEARTVLYDEPKVTFVIEEKK